MVSKYSEQDTRTYRPVHLPAKGNYRTRVICLSVYNWNPSLFKLFHSKLEFIRFENFQRESLSVKDMQLELSSTTGTVQHDCSLSGIICDLVFQLESDQIWIIKKIGNKDTSIILKHVVFSQQACVPICHVCKIRLPTKRLDTLRDHCCKDQKGVSVEEFNRLCDGVQDMVKDTQICPFEHILDHGSASFEIVPSIPEIPIRQKVQCILCFVIFWSHKHFAKHVA